MNIDSFLKFFVPKDHSFFPLFEHSVHNLVKASGLLKELMSTEDFDAHERIYNEIQEIEHVGDQLTNKTYDQLNKSFITPFDREDIPQLTDHIDDVLDSINGISRRINLYKPKKLIASYGKMADLIYEVSKEIETAVLCLKDPVDNKKKITHACERMNSIEHDADEVYFSSVAELFRLEEDTKELIKNSRILDILERCVDEEQDVTDTLKAILIKMA